MNKYILFVLLVLGVITACDDRPKEVLSDQKMEAVMVDLFLFEGAAHVKHITVADTIKPNYYKQILKKHAIALAQYDSSLVWYMKNPKHYIALNERVTKQLKKLEKDIKAGKFVRPIAPTDSLDSMLIRVEKKEVYIVPNTPIPSTNYIIKEKGLVSGDLFSLSFQVRIDGELKKMKASSIISIYYTDNSRDVKKISLIMDSILNKYNISLISHKKKKISSIKVNLCKIETPLSATQRIYINDIVMHRVFNPYRRIK